MIARMTGLYPELVVTGCQHHFQRPLYSDCPFHLTWRARQHDLATRFIELAE